MTGAFGVVRYAPWQLRDVLVKMLAPLGIFTALVVFPIWVQARSAGWASFGQPGLAQDFAVRRYEEGLPLALVLGAILLMSGVASIDRDRQHVRFLFSRPVAPWRFYAQQYLLSVAVFVGVMTLIPVLFGAAITGVPIEPVVRTAALYAVLYGGLGLLCGALLNRDGVAFIAVMVMSQALQAADRTGQLGGVLSATAKALPPLGAGGEIRAAWFADRAADVGDLQHVIAYGLGMVIVALVVIAKRPLVR